MLDKLEQIADEYIRIGESFSDPAVQASHSKMRDLGKRRAEIEPIVNRYHEFRDVLTQIQENRALMDDKSTEKDIRELAELELPELQEKAEELEKKIQILLLPKDPNDNKNIIVEIRAGAGGDEAALFSADLMRMYLRYSESRNWKHELLSSSPTGIGGFKEIIFTVSGDAVYSRMKYESGVHRVQRVPETEAQGRIHTSTCTVAVLPEAEDVDVKIDPNEIRIDVYRSSGPGGQSVNTTDSAVRITHLPTGLVVSCQDEKSQLKNKNKALMILRARLYDLEEAKLHKARSENRKTQVGTGDRSERIRTYNFPQNRLTDHRIGLTLYKLDEIIEGHLEEMIDSISSFFQAEQLAKMSGDSEE